jgi:hypothetical protein
MYRHTTNVGHIIYDDTNNAGATGLATKGVNKNLEGIPGKYSIHLLYKTAIL